ncbi:MAG: hypothetical protein KatS3mg102_2648 [Planctomycetota bacterium]|nr:MAG: hypothetical protein KatS3mg102_2648 [Planctomycetota bacterium]
MWEGWLELGAAKGSEQFALPLAVRAGRQVLALGDEKLVGPLDYLNDARTFDGVRVLSELGPASLSAWWVREVRFRRHDRRSEADFYGLYATVRPRSQLVLEAFYLLKYDHEQEVEGERPGRAPLQVHSPGVRAVWRPVPALELDLYAVVQLGRFGRDPLLAGAGSVRARWRAPAWLRPLAHLGLEYHYGSGDLDPQDGRHHTFDNFFPTNHKFYGEMDLASWRNASHLGAELALQLAEWELFDAPLAEPAGRWERLALRARRALLPDRLPLGVKAAFWQFWLARRRDAWYDAAGRPLRRDPTGRAGRQVGCELDLSVQLGPARLVYSRFWPGPFAERTGASGAATQLYVELALAF